MPDYDLHFQPKDLIPNLIYQEDDDHLSDKDKETLAGVEEVCTTLTPRHLCRACGWNSQHELGSSYLPRICIRHTRENGGLWSVGNDWMLWDRTNEERGNDYMTHQFLQKQNTKDIPLVKRMVEFKDENGLYNFVVMSRAKGVPLESVWKGLSRKQKRSYAQQMAIALRELRQFTAEFPQRVDGSPLWDSIIASCDSRKECIKIGKTPEEWINNMEEELLEGISRQLRTMDKTVINAKLQEFKQNFPDGAPYVLTHADLNLGNILVHDGKIVAIIDWELAGYYPWWAEVFTSYYRALSGAGKELFDMVWKELDLNIDDVRKKLSPIFSAHKLSPVSHTGRTYVWRRPPFCKCEKSGGVILAHHIDSEDNHFVDYNSRRPFDEEWMR
ncbi:hypothetical protein J1614_011346 [Plenodomus biglobosus]|nr:hypothetical protein J1614_011346 [Plenodomus biglobosus]